MKFFFVAEIRLLQQNQQDDQKKFGKDNREKVYCKLDMGEISFIIN